MATNQYPVGQPIGGLTPEIQLKRLQTQIAERRSAIKKLKIEQEDLITVGLPRIEGLILIHENDIKHLLGQLDSVQVIDVIPNKEG